MTFTRQEYLCNGHVGLATAAIAYQPIRSELPLAFFTLCFVHRICIHPTYVCPCYRDTITIYVQVHFIKRVTANNMTYYKSFYIVDF